MYTEGLQIGENSYVLSDESGDMILLSANGTSEDVEKYLKLENNYDEKLNEKSEIQSIIQSIQQSSRRPLVGNDYQKPRSITSRNRCASSI